jgi:formylglycine-generating enzyme required for sulfatase activity/membrane protease YdiL (CAAX protease family)
MSFIVINSGILGELYFAPYSGYASHALLPHLILMCGTGWLVLCASKQKYDAIAYVAATIILVGGFYWTIRWSMGGVMSVPASRVALSGISFVMVPEGYGTAGSPENEYGHKNDEEQHQFVLRENLWFSQMEITQKQFERILGKDQNKSLQKSPELPVNNITLRVAKRLCEELSRRDSSWHFRIPTQDEWEYACRAGMKGPIGTGTKGDPSDPGNFDRLSRDLSITAIYQSTGPAKVGTKLPNKWGLYDMQGNVAEMCCEQPDEWMIQTVYVRGGSWAGNYLSARCASKATIDSEKTNASIGLRIVAIPSNATANSNINVSMDPSTKSKWAVYIDRVCRGIGCLFLLAGLFSLLRRPSAENRFVPIEISETKIRSNTGPRLPITWIVIWIIACTGAIIYPYLDFSKMNIFSKQTYPVQKNMVAAISSLASLILIPVCIKLLYPASGYKGYQQTSYPKILAILQGIGHSLVLFLLLRPVLDISTLINQKIVSHYLTGYIPSQAGILSVIGNFTPAGSQTSLNDPMVWFRKYGPFFALYTTQFIGILFEEAFFRGLLQGYFRLIGGRWSAILLANLIYTALVLSTMPDQIAPMFLIGLAAGYSREWRYYSARTETWLLCPIMLRLLLCARGFVWLHLGIPYASI